MSVLYSTATFIFSNISDISSKTTLVSDVFSSEFPEISSLNTPKDAPVEIPRFVLFSHHKFSTIVITSNMIQLSTRFDNNFSEDWIGRCKPYLEKKVNLIFNFFKVLNMNPKYCGLTVNSILTVANSSVTKIENLFLKKKFISNLNLYDVLIKQSFEFEDEYFINLQLQNQRYQQNQMTNLENIQILPEMNNKIGITLDMNDRKIANRSRAYFSTKESFEKILIIADDVLKSGLANLVSKGEIQC
ncbi:MAG: hypothetical protein SPE30_06200 [Candidatus Treponema excrementipullorum]|nr:hypothetical protein [Candidatus Treponema excrementipullorum]